MNYASLLKKHCPIFKFHEAETYYPCSIEFYLDSSRKDNKNKVVQNIHTITPNNLCEVDNDTETFLDIDKSAWKHNFHTNTPIYTTVAETKMFFILQYILLFPYNGPFDVMGMAMGEHQCDIEHVTVHVSKDLDEITEIYYSAHTHKDGMWVNRDDIEFVKTHPIVYVAKNSHAMYSEAKTYWRILGFANDHTSNDGIMWKPNNIQYIDDETNWNQFKGYLGAPKECTTPKHREWWKGENGVSTTWWKRFFNL